MGNLVNMLYRRSNGSICKEFSYFPMSVLAFFIFLAPVSVKIIKADPEELTSPPPISGGHEVLKEPPNSDLKGIKPQIAIVIDDLGSNLELSERAIRLAPSITLAFLPYPKIVPLLAQHAISTGHEVLIHMPMEPLDSSIDPGPGALLLNMTFRELLKQLRWSFKQIPGAVGLNNHMGSKFTQDENALSTLMGELKARDMLFLDSRTTPDTKAFRMARKRNVRSTSRDVFLDNNRSKKAIKSQLALVEAISLKNGRSVAIGHPYPETLSVLEEWLTTLETRGYSSVPISQLVSAKN